MTNTDKIRDEFEAICNAGYSSDFDLFEQTWQAATHKAAPGWRDIADAPEDGTKYWATDGEHHFTENQPPNCYPGQWTWFEKEQTWGGSMSTHKATHFMPLPPAPGGDK